ncbi:MAG TPA: winged helix-turn-helix domain-containing protein [Steroidobacteraceae bacterium]|jgi:DNA-binding response OmpR family regulator
MPKSNRNPICVGELVFTPGDPRVRVGSESIVLRAQELALLELLTRHMGQLVSTATLAKHLGHGRPLIDTTVAVYVHRLRARLAPAGLTIRVLRGFGYTLEGVNDRPHGALPVSVTQNSNNSQA